MSKVLQYAKAIVGALTVAFTTYQAVGLDTQQDVTTVIAAGVVALVAVFWTANDPWGRFADKYAKAIVGGLVAAVAQFLAVRAGGVTGPEWQAVIVAGLAAGGLTWGVPNTLPSIPSTHDSDPVVAALDAQEG